MHHKYEFQFVTYHVQSSVSIASSCTVMYLLEHAVFREGVAALKDTMLCQHVSIPRIFQYTFLDGLLHLYLFQCSTLYIIVLYWATCSHGYVCEYDNMEQNDRPDLETLFDVSFNQCDSIS